jgi:hypothetical protein
LLARNAGQCRSHLLPAQHVIGRFGQQFVDSRLAGATEARRDIGPAPLRGLPADPVDGTIVNRNARTVPRPVSYATGPDRLSNQDRPPSQSAARECRPQMVRDSRRRMYVAQVCVRSATIVALRTPTYWRTAPRCRACIDEGELNRFRARTHACR